MVFIVEPTPQYIPQSGLRLTNVTDGGANQDGETIFGLKKISSTAASLGTWIMRKGYSGT